MNCFKTEASIALRVEDITNRGMKEITNTRNIVREASSTQVILLALHGLSRIARLIFTLLIIGLSTNAAVASIEIEIPQGMEQKKGPDQPNMEGLVEVSFKVDATGKIQIVHINSTSPELTEYVVKKLAKIKLDNSTGSSGKVITYRFVFKKQA